MKDWTAEESGFPRILLFDWDNTLVDNWESIRAALNATFRGFGLDPWSLEETKQRVRRSLRDSFPEMFGDRWEEARALFYAEFEAGHLNALTPLEGAETLVKAAVDAGATCGVISNKRGDLLRRECDVLGWTRFFHRVIGANDAVRDKPDPAPLALALEGLPAVGAGEVWYIGDAPTDLEFAHVTGCVPVLVETAGHDPAEFEASPPRHRFANCAEINAYLFDSRLG